MDDIGLFNSYVDLTPSTPAAAANAAYVNAVQGSATGQAYSQAVDTIIVDPAPLNLSQPIVSAVNAAESAVHGLIPSKSTIFGAGILVAIILLLVLLIVGKVEAL